MNELRFDGRAVIVTGAGRGVGREPRAAAGRPWRAGCGRRLRRRARRPRLVGRTAAQVVKEIEAAGGEAVACNASVADEAGAATIVQTALDAFGRLDVVINNAGISDPGWFEDLSTEQFRRMLDVHYLGTVYVLKAGVAAHARRRATAVSSTRAPKRWVASIR